MDTVAANMQKKIIEISERRLGKKLPDDIISRIKTYTGYIGLEMIMNYVSAVEIENLEPYLLKL